MKKLKKIIPDFLNIIFIKKKKKSESVKIIPSEPLIEFEKNFIEKK